MWRSRLEKYIYKLVVRPIMFCVPAEEIHDRMIRFGHFCSKSRVMRWKLRILFNYDNPLLEQNVLGLKFRNPIGLAAGFDKNGMIVPVLPSIGLAYGEIGSVTINSHEGNPKPWLHRLSKYQSLVVHYGLKNEGAKVVAKRLEQTKTRLRDFPVGVSVAAASPPHEKAKAEVIRDVVEAMKTVSAAADYLTINISCPNIYNAPDFLSEDNLKDLLTEVKKQKIDRPIFLKLSPDVNDDGLRGIVEVSTPLGVAGFIAGNLTKDRGAVAKGIDIPIPGGISGKLTQNKSDKLIERLYKLTRGRAIIIGCGGIFSAEDAYKKIGLGANLLQMITGLIYEGPEVVSEINWGLAKMLKRDGYKSVSEAVGWLIK